MLKSSCYTTVKLLKAMGSWPLELAWLHEPLGPKWNSSYKQKTGQIHCTSRFGLTILLGKSVFGEIAIPIGSQVWVAQQSAMQRCRRLYIVSGYCSYSLWFWKSTTYEPCEVSFHFGNCVSSRFYISRGCMTVLPLCAKLFLIHAHTNCRTCINLEVESRRHAWFAE